MKIAFLTPSVSRKAGGIFETVRRLAQSLAALVDTHVSVHGLVDEHTGGDLPTWQPLVPITYPVIGPRFFGYSLAMQQGFFDDPADIAHLHALWMFTSVLVYHGKRRGGRPYLVTPRGMLEPWALRNSGWKKRIASLLYERRMLNNAACIHALTEAELAAVRAFGLRNPVCVIPNGVELPNLANPASGNTGSHDAIEFSALAISSLAAGRKVLLYLGRIHPKKGLVNLIRAWGAIHRKSKIENRKSEDWVLVVAGWDQAGHETELKRLATELGVAWADLREQPEWGQREAVGDSAGGISAVPDGRRAEVRASSLWFVGPQFGAAKAAWLRACDAFVLPSFSEGQPVAVLEAWSYAKPVVMTPECNLPEGFGAGAALCIRHPSEMRNAGPSPDRAGPIGHRPPATSQGECRSIAEGLREMMELSDAGRRAMGARGRALVQERFSWPKIAREMKSVYEWVLGGGGKPSCVIMD